IHGPAWRPLLLPRTLDLLADAPREEAGESEPDRFPGVRALGDGEDRGLDVPHGHLVDSDLPEPNAFRRLHGERAVELATPRDRAHLAPPGIAPLEVARGLLSKRRQSPDLRL